MTFPLALSLIGLSALGLTSLGLALMAARANERLRAELRAVRHNYLLLAAASCVAGSHQPRPFVSLTNSALYDLLTVVSDEAEARHAGGAA